MRISLFAGKSLLVLSHAYTIYDGSAPEAMAPHYRPCEPVLWEPTPETLACCVRTESSMDIGLSRFPYANWRWVNTGRPLHPSTVLRTPHGWLLAAREEVLTGDRSLPTERQRFASRQKEWRTALFKLPAGYMIPRRLLALPSGGDTGYAGLALGAEEGTVLCSFYSQHDTLKREAYSTTLPGASVYIATVRIIASP